MAVRHISESWVPAKRTRLGHVGGVPGSVFTFLIAVTMLFTLDQAFAQGLRPSNPYAEIDRGIVASEAAQETAGSIAVLTEKIKGLAERSAAGTTAPGRLADQARSLAQQIDILAQDSAFENVNLVGPGAKPHTIDLPGKQTYTIPARELTSKSLGLDSFEFGSKSSARQAAVQSKQALATLRGAEKGYASHARRLRGKRPAGMIGGVPRPKTGTNGGGSAGGLDINALHKRLGIGN